MTHNFYTAIKNKNLFILFIVKHYLLYVNLYKTCTIHLEVDNNIIQVYKSQIDHQIRLHVEFQYLLPHPFGILD